jgi:sugar lactone lactonase YvrE
MRIWTHSAAGLLVGWVTMTTSADTVFIGGGYVDSFQSGARITGVTDDLSSSYDFHHSQFSDLPGTTIEAIAVSPDHTTLFTAYGGGHAISTWKINAFGATGTLNGTLVESVGNAGGTFHLTGMNFGKDGFLYGYDDGGRIVRINSSTGAYSTFISSLAGSTGDLVFASDGSMWVSAAGTISHYSSTGAFLNGFTPLGITHNDGGGAFLAIGPDGNIYTTGGGNGQNGVYRYSQTGTPLPAAGQTGALYIQQPTNELWDNLAFDSVGNLFVEGINASSATYAVAEYSGTTLTAGLLLHTGGLTWDFNGASPIAVDSPQVAPIPSVPVVGLALVGGLGVCRWLRRRAA